jgi:hypothetical protein
VSVPRDLEVTEVGNYAKFFNGERIAPPARDLGNPGDVYLLAESAVRMNRRQLMRVTLSEIRALASFAVWSGAVAARFAEVLELSDAGAPAEQLVSALKKAAETARAASSEAVGAKGSAN